MAGGPDWIALASYASFALAAAAIVMILMLSGAPKACPYRKLKFD